MSALSPGAALFLVDSSAWISVLRRGGQGTSLWQRVDDLLAAGAVATTGIIRLEILRGARDELHAQRLGGLFAGLHQLPTDEPIWEAAAQLGRQLRAKGLSAQNTDLLIAAVAMRSGATLIHRDGDFDQIATHAPLSVESFV